MPYLPIVCWLLLHFCLPSTLMLRISSVLNLLAVCLKLFSFLLCFLVLSYNSHYVILLPYFFILDPLIHIFLVFLHGLLDHNLQYDPVVLSVELSSRLSSFHYATAAAAAAATTLMMLLRRRRREFSIRFWPF